MSSKKQSSVEWLENQLKERYSLMNSEPLFEQAKAMHKDEIEDAVNFGDEHGQITTYLTVEKYYNETFGGNNE
jgi:hypothetical protein